MNLCYIIPRIGGTGCGVGDYASLLAARLEVESGLMTYFLAVELRPASRQEDPCARRVERRSEALAKDLEGQQQILLHYVGYGYQKRGCPLWLLDGLQRWKRENPDARLVTMFHELYASGRPWQSSFWTSPLQRWICREIAGISDGIVTNREASAEILKRMSGRQDVWNLPVFSNVGEPDQRRPMGEREARLVIFGGKGWRGKALGDDLEDLRAACRKWRVEEVIEIGPGATPEVDLGVPLRKLGSLPVAEVSEWLGRSRLGFVSYPSSYLEKSGIYAAYAAHGVVPVLPQKSLVKETMGVVEGRHYVGAETDDGSIAFLEERSKDVFSWYQGHRVSEHGRVFVNLLNP